jgi:hypothetical protein
MPTIRIDDDVFSRLQRLATPFVDTPNSVIRRLLDSFAGAETWQPANQQESRIEEAPTANPARDIATELDGLVEAEYQNRRFARTPAGKLTPQPVLEDWILVVLDAEFDGSAEKKEVTDEIVRQLAANGITSKDDFEVVSTGETKVANTIAWGRNRLKELGFISRISPRGVWELTESGRGLARRLRGLD